MSEWKQACRIVCHRKGISIHSDPGHLRPCHRPAAEFPTEWPNMFAYLTSHRYLPATLSNLKAERAQNPVIRPWAAGRCLFQASCGQVCSNGHLIPPKRVVGHTHTHTHTWAFLLIGIKLCALKGGFSYLQMLKIKIIML